MHLDTHRADRCIALLLQNLDATLEGLLHVVKHAFEVIGGLDHGAVHVLDVLHRLAGVQDGDGGSIVDVHHKRFPFVRVAHLRLIDQLGGGVQAVVERCPRLILGRDVLFRQEHVVLVHHAGCCSSHSCSYIHTVVGAAPARVVVIGVTVVVVTMMGVTLAFGSRLHIEISLIPLPPLVRCKETDRAGS